MRPNQSLELTADRRENFPPDILGKQRKLALLFKKVATLRTDAPLCKKIETLRWRGATPAFAKWAKRMKAPRLRKGYAAMMAIRGLTQKLHVSLLLVLFRR